MKFYHLSRLLPESLDIRLNIVTMIGCVNFNYKGGSVALECLFFLSWSSSVLFNSGQTRKSKSLDEEEKLVLYHKCMKAIMCMLAQAYICMPLTQNVEP